jgi:DNA primase
MTAFDTVKERIRDAVDIVDLIGQYIPLRRQGSMYVGMCPWHDDSRPSLQVNPQRQSFKCWVCDIGGDIFSFVMKAENADFTEALEILSEKTGIALPRKRRENADPKNDAPDKKTLLKAADYVAGLYHRALLTMPEAETARQYLSSRKIDEEAVKKFRIGYAPLEANFLQSNCLQSHSGSSTKRQQVLELIGNLKNGRDFFGGRLIFPIRNDRGHTVAFGGRLIPNSPLSRDDWHKDRKYLNTSETPIFSKHKILYGLDTAKQRMKETRRALIVEGYTDCITAHQFGFTDAAAVLGTALGREHIKLLSRMGAEKMILMLDGDKAGQAKAENDNVLTDFISQGADMSVLILPENLDPCEFLETYGAEALESLLQTQAVNALEHLFRIKTRGIDIKTDIIASSKALNSILGIIAHSPAQKTPNDPAAFRIEKTLQTLSVRFGMPLDEIKKRLNTLKAEAEKAEHRTHGVEREKDSFVPNVPVQNAFDSNILPLEPLPDFLEREMLELFLAEPTAVYQFWEGVPPERCRSPVTKIIYAKCNELVELGKPATVQNLLTAFDDSAMKNLLLTFADKGEEKFRNKNKETLDAAVREITAAFDRRDSQHSQLQELNRIKDNTLSETEKTNQLLRIQQELQKKQKRHEHDTENGGEA